MPYLEYISDENFTSLIVGVVNKVRDRISEIEKDYNSSVIDPFSTLFEMALLDTKTVDDWLSKEKYRQAQKTLSMQLGNLHQNILGFVDGWENLGVGNKTGADLRNENRKIIAEIKNKHNTVKKSDEIHYFRELEQLVMLKNSPEKDYTAYYVTILPEKPKRFNREFAPSDKAIGGRVAANPLIRIIDGASFYHLVTGRENALFELQEAIPKILSDLGIVKFEDEKSKFIAQLFETAFSPD